MEYNDDELIYYIHLHNKTAYDILYDKYLRLINIILCRNLDFSVVNKFEYNDMVQECLLTFNKAVYSYRNEEGTFYMYFHSIIYNVLSTHLKEFYNRKKSLVYECQQDDDETSIFLLISDPYSISENYNYDEERKYMIKQCKNELENNVLYLKQEGYTYKEISKLLNINNKKIDYILSNIKKKYKKFID